MIAPIGLSTLILAAVTPERETVVTELRRLPEGWLAIGGFAMLAGLCWIIVWMYRKEGRRGASSGVRLFLASLRCVTILTLVLILLEPVRVRIVRKWIESYVLVLLDSSSSMDIADRYRDDAEARRIRDVLGADASASPRRIELADRVLTREGRKFIRELASNNRVKLFTFSDEPSLVATVPAAWESSEAVFPPVRPEETPLPADPAADFTPPAVAAGAVTNVERAVRRAVESVGNSPVAAVIVLSDGGFNQGATAEEVARFAADRRVAVHTVGFGDPSTPRSLAVTELLAPENAFQRDPFPITATLATQGVAGHSVRIHLRERAAEGEGEGQVVESRDVLISGDGAVEQVAFQRKQESVGRFTYTVEAAALPEETVLEDNSRHATVNVIDTRTKVLLIAGSPSWEYRYLSVLLQRDNTFDVSCWLQPADANAVRDGDVVIDHLPATPEELFSYDVVILMDPDKDEFDEEWCRLVDTFVTDHGGGFLYQAARPFAPAFMREKNLKTLHDLLPVVLDPEADLALNQIGHYQLSGTPIEIPATSVSHPVLQLGGDPTSSRLAWSGIGDIHWYFPVLREKPVATVLMRKSNPRVPASHGNPVLSAVQYVGAGRTAMMAFDGTWRWRKHGEEFFDRFWVQLLRYLAEGKLLGGSRRAMLQVENDRPSLGEAVNLSARLLDARFEPLQQEEATARVRIEHDQFEVILRSRSDRPGCYEGRFIPDRMGSFRVSLDEPGATPDRNSEIVREVLVSRPNLEIIQPQMHKPKLVALADGSIGGRFWPIDEAAALPATIPDLHEEIPVRSRPVALWDNAWMLTFLLLLVSVEWAVRKWNRLL